MRDTPSRLREAARRLLAERGESRISLRDITDAAGANVASVGYHFGSKDALLAEVIRAAFAGFAEHQRHELAALADDASLDRIVRVWLGPALSPADLTESTRLQWGILRNALTEPSATTMALLAEASGEVDALLLTRLARHLPHLSPAELGFRHAATLAAVGSLTAGGLRALLPDDDHGGFADHLVTWVIAGLRAPATGSARSG